MATQGKQNRLLLTGRRSLFTGSLKHKYISRGDFWVAAWSRWPLLTGLTVHELCTNCLNFTCTSSPTHSITCKHTQQMMNIKDTTVETRYIKIWYNKKKFSVPRIVKPIFHCITHDRSYSHYITNTVILHKTVIQQRSRVSNCSIRAHLLCLVVNCWIYVRMHTLHANVAWKNAQWQFHSKYSGTSL